MDGINLLGGLPGHERKGGGFQTGYEVFGSDGISPTVLAHGGGYGIMVINEVRVMGQMDNTIDHTFESANRVYDKDGLCPTIPTCAGGNIQPKITEGRPGDGKTPKADGYRIRRLTPRECWRLMGYTDEDFGRAASVSSDTQLYKQAGNAIVKQVLMAIFRQLGIRGVRPWNKAHGGTE